MPEWGEKVLDYVNRSEADLLVVTGDLTHDGYPHEYDVVKEYFDRIEVENVLVVPGNHDSYNEGYVVFEEIFKTRFPVYKNDDLVMVGVDSSEPDIDIGQVGRHYYPIITDNFTGGNRNKIKMLAMHHHLIPIPGTGRERQIPTDAGDILGLLSELGADFVLTGHKHKPWVWKLEDTCFITAGTASTRRLKGRSYPSFNVIEIEPEKTILNRINVIDGSTIRSMVLK